MNTELRLTILRIVLGVVTGGYSVSLAIHQLHGRTHTPLLILAIAELIGAILLLIPRTARVGGIALIVVFAIAAVFHILHGEFDVAFLAIYAAAALAVIPHGDRRAR